MALEKLIKMRANIVVDVQTSLPVCNRGTRVLRKFAGCEKYLDIRLEKPARKMWYDNVIFHYNGFNVLLIHYGA